VSIQQNAAEEGQVFQRPCKALIELFGFFCSLFFRRAWNVFAAVYKTLR
jgi:hypothetical protein